MRHIFCLTLLAAVLLLAPVQAQAIERLSPMVVQGLESFAQAKATYTPTVDTWPTASAITYGQTLESSTLTGGSASVDGSFAFTDPNTQPDVGTYAASVTFTPTDTTTYNTVTGTVTVKVGLATPTVTTWPTASSITYGQTLASSTLTGGAASVSGTFAFTTPSTAPGVGTYSAPVTFTPTDTAKYGTVAGTANVVVAAAAGTTVPTISVWPTASTITEGETLASSTLTGGTASVSGTFAYTDPTIEPPAGSYAAAVTFTPADTTSYSAVSGLVNVTVEAATDDYTWIDYLGIPLLVLLALGIVRLAEWDRVGGPCFIATAAWGTPLAPEVNRLREFRDHTLLAGALGTAAVDVYYHMSPAIADLVAASPGLAMLVRIALIPVLVIISLPAPLVTGLAVLAAIMLVRRAVRRRRKDRPMAD